MQDDTQFTRDIAQRLSAIAAQLQELARDVAEVERRSREREDAVKAVLSTVAGLSNQLRSFMPADAGQEARTGAGQSADRTDGLSTGGPV